MNTGRTVFSQLMDYLPTYEFEKCVNRYSGDYRSRSLSCRDQFLAMAFAQLTYRESLRDIETCLRSIGSKLYHMGFRSTIARSTLADANESRDWRTCDRDQSLRIVRKDARFRSLVCVHPLLSLLRRAHQRKGTSDNAVKTQIWIAVSVYVLVAIVRKRLGLEMSLYQILQIFSITLLEKLPILSVLEAFDSRSDLLDNSNQLILFDF